MTVWLYVLRCADGSYYVGTTRVDPEIRVSEHNAGVHPRAWTARRRPVTLAFSEPFADASDAVAAERQVKGWRREKKDALIRRDFALLPALSRRGRGGPREG
ncbi:MAG: GIY-YIG nuclease family protein [Alsobacter sp.]